MAFHAAAAADIPLLITSPNSSSERRITPSWSIAHLKTRLEPITGIPASSQKLTLRVGTQDGTAIVADDEEKTQLSAFPLQAYAEINVSRRELSCYKRNTAMSCHVLEVACRSCRIAVCHIFCCFGTWQDPPACLRRSIIICHSFMICFFLHSSPPQQPPRSVVRLCNPALHLILTRPANQPVSCFFSHRFRFETWQRTWRDS